MLGATPEGADERTTTRGWKERLDDPLNRLYRYPVARLLVRGLVKTPVTPNQVSFAQPFVAAAAAYLVSFPDRAHLAAGALVFELRSILDCADGTLARARGGEQPGGHAVDALADWIGVLLLYAGLFAHFRQSPPAGAAWGDGGAVACVLLVALAQGALRSFAADYYKRKLAAIFERGVDGTVGELCDKARALRPGAPIATRIEVGILRLEHLVFEHERFDPARTAPRPAHVALLRSREHTPLARALAVAWSLSNGDAFLSFVTLSLLAGSVWETQVFFASFGLPWIVAVMALSTQLAAPGHAMARRTNDPRR